MDDNKQPLLWVILVAILGVGMPWASRPAQTESETKTDASSSPESAAAAREPPPSSCEVMMGSLELLRAPPRPADHYHAQVVIATVPDPRDSVLDYGFDRAVDAIRGAADAAGYQAGRYSFPWIEGKAKSSEDDHKDADSATGAAPWQTVPGWMLFHKPPESGATEQGSTEVLEVLLVGETTAWGVHPEAFRCAIQEALANETVVRLAGPVFSGSTESIVGGLERYLCANPESVTVHVRNGGATAPGLKQRLYRPFGPVKCANGSSSVAHMEIDYASTVADVKQALSAFTRYVVKDLRMLQETSLRAGSGTQKVCNVNGMGVLIEAGTAYGAGAASQLGLGPIEGRHPRPPGVASGLDEPCESDEPSGVTSAMECDEYVPSFGAQYPAHVARLRTEHERQHRILTRSKQHETEATPPRSLELSLDRDKDPVEVVPLLSSKTAYSEDLVLSEAIRGMCRQGVRLLGILGTDTIDRLFLANEVKTQCPDVRLFFLESDIFYAHPDYSAVLDGSLVLSSYPLILRNRAWAFPFDSVMIGQFGSSGEHGLYNAMLSLLSEDPKCRAGIERGLPFRCQAGEVQNPIWVTAVGNGAFWPLAVLEPRREAQDSGRDAGKDSASPNDISNHRLGDRAKWRFDTSGSWRFLPGLWTVLGLFLAVGYWVARGTRRDQRLPWGLQWAEVFRAGAERSWRRPAFSLVALAPLTMTYFVLLWTWFVEVVVTTGSFTETLKRPFIENVLRVNNMAPHRSYPSIVVGLALAAAVIDILAVLIAREKLLPLKRAVLVAVAVLLHALLASGIFRGIHPFVGSTDESVRSAILFRERNGNLSSGASILLPAIVLAGALFLGGYSNLQRLSPGPWAEASKERRGPGHEILEPIPEEVTRRHEGLLTLGAGVLVALLVYFLFHRRLGTLEIPAFEQILAVAGCLVCGLAAAAYVGFVKGWWDMRRSLARHAASGLGAAFGRLPPRYVNQLGGLLLVRPPDIEKLGSSVGRFKRFEAALEATLKGLLASATTLQSMPDSMVRLATALPKISLPKGEDLVDIYRRELSSKGLSDATLGDTYKEMRRRSVPVAEALAEIYGTTLPLADEVPSEGSTAGRSPVSGEPKGPLVLLAEEVVAVVIACRLFHKMRRLRRLLTLATVTPILLLTMVASYPFEARGALLWAIQGEMLLVICISIAAFVDMDRNEVLSRIHDTTPGKVSFSRALAVKVLLFAVVPVMTMVATDIPAVGQVMFGWFLPLLRQIQ